MLTFELVTLEGIKFSEECFEIILPTEQGQIAVFPNHVPLVSVAAPGIVSVRIRESDPDAALHHYAIDGGVIEVGEHRIRVLADEAQSAEDIDQAQAQAALQRAKELQKQAEGRVALADATALVERHLAQLKVAELKNRRPRHR